MNQFTMVHLILLVIIAVRIFSMKTRTLVYTDTGNIFLGEFADQYHTFWEGFGCALKDIKWMYKGFKWKRTSAKDKIKQSFVIFSIKQWSQGDIVTARIGGFLGIREHKIEKLIKINSI